MTEVPEHLLRRSKERRSGAGGSEGGAATGGEGQAGSTSTAVEPAAAATPAPAGGGAAPTPATPTPAAAVVAPAYTGPPQGPHRRERVPAWALPVLAALPLWAILYSGAFGERKVAAEGPVAVGAGLYRAQGCSGCHGSNGEGGVGPPLAQVTKTFPAFGDHVAWIKSGSAPVKGQPYGATGNIATGGMPSFSKLTEEEVVAIACHERVAYGKAELPPECEEGAIPAP